MADEGPGLGHDRPAVRGLETFAQPGAQPPAQGRRLKIRNDEIGGPGAAFGEALDLGLKGPERGLG